MFGSSVGCPVDCPGWAGRVAVNCIFVLPEFKTSLITAPSREALRSQRSTLANSLSHTASLTPTSTLIFVFTTICPGLHFDFHFHPLVEHRLTSRVAIELFGARVSCANAVTNWRAETRYNPSSLKDTWRKKNSLLDLFLVGSLTTSRVANEVNQQWTTENAAQSACPPGKSNQNSDLQPRWERVWSATRYSTISLGEVARRFRLSAHQSLIRILVRLSRTLSHPRTGLQTLRIDCPQLCHPFMSLVRFSSMCPWRRAPLRLLLGSESCDCKSFNSSMSVPSHAEGNSTAAAHVLPHLTQERLMYDRETIGLD